MTEAEVRSRLREGWALGLLAVAALLGSLGVGLDSTTGKLVLVGLVVLLGVPHGAFDYRIALALDPPRSLRDHLRFLFGYLAASVAVIAVWALAPELCLLLFLALTVAHFGLADRRRAEVPPALEVVARGGLPIALPIALQPEATAPLFAVLVDTDPAAVERWTVAAGPFALAAWIVVAVSHVALLALAHGGRRLGPAGEDALELAALAGIFALLPPLPAFLIYFCAWHSARHTAVALSWIERRARGSTRRILAETGVVWIGALLVLGLVWVLAPDTLVETPGDRALRALFIGLAALTVPHVVLVDGRARPAFQG